MVSLFADLAGNRPCRAVVDLVHSRSFPICCPIHRLRVPGNSNSQLLQDELRARDQYAHLIEVDQFVDFKRGEGFQGRQHGKRWMFHTIDDWQGGRAGAGRMRGAVSLLGGMLRPDVGIVGRMTRRCRRRNIGRVGSPVVVPADPDIFEPALAVVSVGQGRKGQPHVSKDAGGHVPREGLEIWHAGHGKSHQSAEHFPALLGDQILSNAVRWAVSEREFLRVLSIAIAQSAPTETVGSWHQRVSRPCFGPLRCGLAEDLLGLDQSGQAVCQSINARPRLGLHSLVWPDDVKAGVYARNGQRVEDRVAQGEGREIVCVRKLRK